MDDEYGIRFTPKGIETFEGIDHGCLELTGMRWQVMVDAMGLWNEVSLGVQFAGWAMDNFISGHTKLPGPDYFDEMREEFIHDYDAMFQTMTDRATLMGILEKRGDDWYLRKPSRDD